MSFLVDLALSLDKKGPLAHFGGSRETRFLRYRPIFREVGGDPFTAALLAGIAWTESDFIPDAIGPAIPGVKERAHGMMQVMEFHFDGLGWNGGDWSVPEKNVAAGLQILRASGFGRIPIKKALANYGGFVNNDPSDYQRKVLTRATFLLPYFLTG